MIWHDLKETTITQLEAGELMFQCEVAAVQQSGICTTVYGQN